MEGFHSGSDFPFSGERALIGMSRQRTPNRGAFVDGVVDALQKGLKRLWFENHGWLWHRSSFCAFTFSYLISFPHSGGTRI